MDATDVRKKLVETLRRFDTVMVATTAENGTMHARPMAIAEVDDDGELWFVTSDDSEKMREIGAATPALVTGQETGRYVSLTGRLDVIKDRDRVRAMWNETWKAWFPDGKDDPTITLLRLRPEIGEYWDSRGTQGVRYLFEAAKAILNGESTAKEIREMRDPAQHAKVPM